MCGLMYDVVYDYNLLPDLAFESDELPDLFLEHRSMLPVHGIGT